MDIIGNSLGSNKDNGIYVTFSKLFKSTLDKIGISEISKESRLKNEQFNEVLHNFFYHIECLKLYLYQRGYKVEKIFQNEANFKKYINKNRIKMKIKNGDILIGNIYGEDDVLKCVGIVLGTKIPKVQEQVSNILEK